MCHQSVKTASSFWVYARSFVGIPLRLSFLSRCLNTVYPSECKSCMSDAKNIVRQSERGPGVAANIVVHAGFAVTGVITTMLGPLLPVLINRWALTDARAGAFFSAQYFAALAGAVTLSTLLAWRGYKLVFVGGLRVDSGGNIGVAAWKSDDGICCYGRVWLWPWADSFGDEFVGGGNGRATARCGDQYRERRVGPGCDFVSCTGGIRAKRSRCVGAVDWLGSFGGRGGSLRWRR